MFARVLYVDDRLALHLNWLGMGALEVVYRDGRRRRAHPSQKGAFLALVDAFAALGQPISPANPKFSRMAKDFAGLLEEPPNGLIWRTFFSETKETRAQQYASDDQ